MRYPGVLDIELTLVELAQANQCVSQQFLLAAEAALAPVIEAAGEGAMCLSLPGTTGRSKALRCSGPSTCLGWRGSKNSDK